MATQTEIFRIELDIDAATKQAAQYQAEIDRITKSQRELRKEGKAGTAEYQKNETALRVLKTGLRDTRKEIDLNQKATKSAQGSNEQLRAKLAQLTKQYNSLSKEERENTKAGKDLQSQVKDISDELKANESAVGDNRRNVGNYTSALQGMGGGIGNVVGALGRMKTAALAFIATPLGLILAAIATALYAVRAAFTSSEEGQNKFAKASAVLNAIIGNLNDVLASLGDFIIEAFENPQKAITDFANLIKDNIVNRFEGLVELIPQLGKAIGLLFEGEFAEAGKVAADATAKVAFGITDITDKVKQASQAVADFVEENIKEGEAAAEVADKRAKADILERKLLVDRAKLESRIAELRLRAREEDRFNAAERRQFLIDARNLQDEVLNREQEYLKLRADAQILENTFSRTNKENKRLEAEAIAAVSQVEARRFNEARTIQRELIRVDRELEREKEQIDKDEQKRKEDINKAILAAEKQILDSKLDANEKEVLASQEKYEALAKQLEESGLVGDELLRLQNELYEAREAEKTAILKKQEEERNDILKKKAKEQKDIDKAKVESTISAYRTSAENIASILNSESAAVKTFQIGLALGDAFVAINKTLADPKLIFPANVITAASIGVQALGNVAQIRKLAHGGEAGGNLHSAGGTKYYGEDGNVVELERGEKWFVLNRKASGAINALSDLNVKHGGVSFGKESNYLRDGGAVQRSIASRVDSQLESQNIVEAIAQMQIAVSVQEINNVQRRVAVQESIATS